MTHTRRQLLKTASAAVATALLHDELEGLAVGQNGQAAKPFTLPPLPYPNDALEVAIDARTMKIHHDGHHAAYVAGLNAAVMGDKALARMSIEQILQNIKQVPETIRQRVINNGGGHYNHSLFWQSMAPRAGGNPGGALAEAINSTFTNFDAFKRRLKDAALVRFGSGWAWLVYADRRLQIVHTGNQDCPLMTGQTPILGLDVWEHAYYLRYQNRRADYVDAWWGVVNWPAVGKRFDQASQQ